jgi:hypothetical protein
VARMERSESGTSAIRQATATRSKSAVPDFGFGDRRTSARKRQEFILENDRHSSRFCCTHPLAAATLQPHRAAKAGKIRERRA